MSWWASAGHEVALWHSWVALWHPVAMTPLRHFAVYVYRTQPVSVFYFRQFIALWPERFHSTSIGLCVGCRCVDAEISHLDFDKMSKIRKIGRKTINFLLYSLVFHDFKKGNVIHFCAKHLKIIIFLSVHTWFVSFYF